MGFVNGHADIEGGEHGEDEGLDISHQAFENTDEDTEDNGDDRHASPYTHGDSVTDDEDDDHESKDDNMSCRHVGEETDHEDDGFGEDTDEFDYGHEGEDFEPGRDSRGIEDVDPIVLVAAEVGDEEGDDREGGCHGKVAGDVGSGREEGNETHAVGEEDEEEECEHIGQVFLVVSFANHRPHNAVTDKYNQHFDQRLKSFGGLVFPFLISIFGDHDYDNKKDDDNHDGGGDFGNGEVEGFDYIA